jgi:rod shape-determining protein MreC
VRRKFNPVMTRGVIISAAVAVALCVWSSAFSLAGATDPLRVAVSTVSAPLTSLLDRVGGGVARGFAATFGRDAQYNEWMQEKAALEAALAEQRQQLAELSSLREQNEQLRAYLSLTEHNASLVLTEARVLYTADTTAQLLTLDRGSRHGIEVGMPVLCADGLIGRVCEVMPSSCKVATLLHEKLAVGVRNARSGVSGTLTATADGLCRVTNMDANMDRATALSEGDVIVTSGYGGNFPSELLVGVVVEYGFDPLDRTPYAIVAPYAD